jgi:hypothetical protein
MYVRVQDAEMLHVLQRQQRSAQDSRVPAAELS